MTQWVRHSPRGVATATSHVVFNRWLDTYPDLAEALTHGSESERLALHDVLFRAVMPSD